VVALNKCDLPRADVNRVKQQLQANDLMPEDWGGSTSCVEISALKGTNIDHLLEIILLEAEMLELKSDPKSAGARRRPRIAGGGRQGTDRHRDRQVPAPFKPRHAVHLRSALGQGARVAERPRRADQVRPGRPSPAKSSASPGPPSVGDEVLEMKSERDAKRLSEERSNAQRLEKLAHPRRNRMEDLFASLDSSVEGPAGSS
jgi:translation initiation factor IF-2